SFLNEFKKRKIIENSFTDSEQLDENNHDFKLFEDTKESYLELTEITPFNISKGFQNAPEVFDIYEFAMKVYNLINEKSDYYIQSKTPIDLLCYSTDYRASLVSTQSLIVKSLLQKNAHLFRY